jgi:putative ABC transport system permease protein
MLPELVNTLWLRIKALFRRRQLDRDLDDELQFHLAMREEKLQEQGVSQDEAHYAAQREFGSSTQAKEANRELWTFPFLETLWQDIRYGLRQSRRSPGFTAVALLTLSLGIGLNTGIFSLVNTVLLRPLPYPDPQRIVVFTRTGPGFVDPDASPARFNIWRRETRIFQDVSAFRVSHFSATSAAFAQRNSYGQVTADFFRLFGASLIIGRTFSESEESPGGGHVAVLGYDFWRDRFHGDLHIVGKTIPLGGHPYDVIGVLGPSSSSPAFCAGWERATPPDVWIPFQLDPNSRDYNLYFTVAGRLKPGITLGMARAELQVAARDYRRANPGDVTMPPNGGFGVLPLQDYVVSGERSTLLLFFGAVVLVLLIACANVANLMLSRGAGRKHEFALRAAVGAGRGRIIRQLLAENGVLAVVGGGLGLGLGFAGIHAVLRLPSVDIPRIGSHGSAVSMDWRVLVFTVLVSLITLFLFGLFPALQSSRVDLNTALKEVGGYLGAGVRRNASSALLVIGEVALALILLVGAGLLMRTFVVLHSVHTGIDSHHVLTVRMMLSGSRFQKPSGVAETVQTTIERIDALPGVVSAGFTCCLPLEGQLIGSINVVGHEPESNAHAQVTTVSPGYFVFRIPLIRGRTFTDHDDSGATPVVVISQSLARKIWPQSGTWGDALKGQIRLLDTPGLPPWQIIGIVGDVRASGLDSNPPPIMYIPVAQTPADLNTYIMRDSIAWIVRTRANPYLLSVPIENTLRNATGGLSALRIRSMKNIVGEYASGRHFSLALMTIFACSAMLLAAIGMYAVIAYSVHQRTHEIGIRMALGAQPRNVLRLVIGQGMILALVGTGIGVLGALVLTRLLARLLYGVKPGDPLTIGFVSLILISVALLACWVPARRAAKVDPMVALRYE